MRQIRTSGSMSGCVETGMGQLVRHRQPKGSETVRLILRYRATIRLYRENADVCVSACITVSFHRSRAVVTSPPESGRCRQRLFLRCQKISFPSTIPPRKMKDDG